MYKVKLSLLLLPLLILTMPSATAEEIRGLPIEVDADSGEYDADRGTTHLRGNVRITRGDLVVHADEGLLHQPDGRIQRIELTGSPATTWRMTQEDGQEAEGESERIIYTVADNRVTMIGNARVRDARGSFSGQRLVYDLDSQYTEGEGGIRMVIEAEAREDGADNGPD